MWLFFVLVHLVGLVGYNLVLRKSLVAKVDKLTLATVMQTGIALPMLVVMLFKQPDWSAYTFANVVQLLVTVALVIALHLTNVKALEKLEAGTYSILYNLRIVFATVLGIMFLNEPVVPLRIAGGILIFLGVLTLRRKSSQPIDTVGIRWGIAAAVVISVLNMLEKALINEVGYLGYSVPVMLGAAAVMWAILLLRGQRIRLAYLRDPKTLELMTLRAISAYGFTLAFNAGAIISVATYLSSLSVIIIVLLGILLLGERDNIRQKTIATGLAVAGITIIFIASLGR